MTLSPTGAPRVTIGFIPRERFSLAAEALHRLIQNTADVPYRLLIVDCATPPRYLQEMESAVAGQPNVEFMRLDHQIMPNRSRQLVAAASTTEYTCMLENDSFVSPSWLSSLVAACERFEAGVAAPLLREGGHYHGDTALGGFRFLNSHFGTRLEFVTLGGKHEAQEAQLVQSVECHCLLFKTKVFQKADVFDPDLTTHDFLDMSLSLHAAGVPIVFEPRSRITFTSPPSIQPDERAFFRRRWNLDSCQASVDHLRAKWQLAEVISAKAFANERLHRESYLQLGLFTLRVRIFRRLRTWYRKYLLHRSLVQRLEYESGPLALDGLSQSRGEGSASL